MPTATRRRAVPRGTDAEAGWLLRPVRELLRPRILTVGPDTHLSEARQLMQFARVRHLPVVKSGILVGVLSYRELLEGLLAEASEDAGEAAGERPARSGPPSRVRDLMHPSPDWVAPDCPLAGAAARMLRLSVGCLPVAEASEHGPRLLGLVTERDLLWLAYAREPEPDSEA